MSSDKIVLTREDLEKSSVQAQVNTQRNIRKASQEYKNKIQTGQVIDQINQSRSHTIIPSTEITKQSDTLYYMIAGLLAGLAGWGVHELQNQFYDPVNVYASSILFTSIIGVCLGFGLGIIEGILERSQPKAIKGCLIGVTIGLFGGGMSGLIGQFAYTTLLTVQDSLELSNYIFARTIAWGTVGLIIGMVPGISVQAGKKIRNGLIGGLIGGALGGAVFDPIGVLLNSGVISRLVGISVIGGAMGVSISLAEEMMKEAWLIVAEGPLKGKQFILYKNPTNIGSSPSNEIYLFKDPNVLPEHAIINISDNSNSIGALQKNAVVEVNGQAVSHVKLRNGDMIGIGQYLLSYSEKS